jgi:hypothetical protein
MTIESALYQRILSAQQVVNCRTEHCQGIMTPVGRIIVKVSTVRKGTTYEFQKKREDLRRKRARPEVYQGDGLDDDGDGAGDPVKRRKLEETDFDYAPSEEYTPAMRFTDGDMEKPVRKTPPSGLATKSTGWVNISAAVAGEREKSTSDQMNGMSAWRYARSNGAPNAGKYKLGSQAHYEWCHMRGVSLGGYTLSANLVAGHYAVNTYMSVIEEYLRGKTAFQLEVVAHCATADIVDFLIYRIRRISDGREVTSLSIDGHITCFSKNDRDRVRGRLKRYL